jgi:hypothetical protein
MASSGQIKRLRKEKKKKSQVMLQSVKRRTVIEIGEPLAREFPYEEGNNAKKCHAARN